MYCDIIKWTVLFEAPQITASRSKRPPTSALKLLLSSFLASHLSQLLIQSHPMIATCRSELCLRSLQNMTSSFLLLVDVVDSG